MDNYSLLADGYWLSISDGDPRGLALYKRHYSYRAYKDGRKPKLFVGPGQKMVLMTINCDALFVWRKFISMDHQGGGKLRRVQERKFNSRQYANP